MGGIDRRSFLRRSGQAALALGATAALGGGAGAAEKVEEGKTVRVPMQVPYQQGRISWVAATTACLKALGVECDAVDVAGHSGYAFLLNICEGLGPCGPTNFDMGRLLGGVHSLGRSTLVFKGGQAAAVREELRAAQEIVEREIAAGRPCVLYGLGSFAEFGVAVGLQDGAYLAAGRSDPVSPENVASSPGAAFVLAFPTALQVDPVQADRQAIVHALEMLRSGTSKNPVSLVRMATGQDAYDEWIAALDSGTIGPHGGYNAQIWAEAKRYARDFAARLAVRNQSIQGPLRQAAAACVEVAAAMQQVADLFPDPPRGKEAEDPDIRAKAAAALRTAKAASAKATEALSEAAAKWTFVPGKGGVEITMLAPCGIDCAKCDILARGHCAGCRGDRRRQWSGDCGLRVCCTDTKHLTLCNQCDQFVCQKLENWAAAYPHHAAAVERLKGMRDGT
ncbi:MAG: DUF3795 domain-containing protein [Armatimonadota bacterium]